MKIILVNRKDDLRMRVDLDPDARVSVMLDIAEDVWGCGRALLRRGHFLIPPDGLVGDFVEDGDYVELLPDPFDASRQREIPAAPGVRTWSVAWGRVRTSSSRTVRWSRCWRPPRTPVRGASAERSSRTPAGISGRCPASAARRSACSSAPTARSPTTRWSRRSAARAVRAS